MRQPLYFRVPAAKAYEVTLIYQGEKTVMRTVSRLAMLALALISLGSISAIQTTANCGPNVVPTAKPTAPTMSERLPYRLKNAAWEKEDESGIVGFWNFSFVAKDSPGIPDSTPIDAGFVQWHRDGTEITNSSRAPVTGNFCLGVWEFVGNATFKLNHFGISWDANGNLIGPARIREEVKLDADGNKYFGTFSIDQYDTRGNLVPMGHVQGQVTGTRINVQTTAQDVKVL